MNSVPVLPRIASRVLPNQTYEAIGTVTHATHQGGISLAYYAKAVNVRFREHVWSAAKSWQFQHPKPIIILNTHSIGRLFSVTCPQTTCVKGLTKVLKRIALTSPSKRDNILQRTADALCSLSMCTSSLRLSWLSVQG